MITYTKYERVKETPALKVSNTFGVLGAYEESDFEEGELSQLKEDTGLENVISLSPIALSTRSKGKKVGPVCIVLRCMLTFRKF